YVLVGGGQNPAPDQEYSAPARYGFGEVPLELGQRGEDEVAEAVAGNPAVTVEAEVEHVRHRRIALGKREQTAPDVAGRRQMVAGPELPGAAAVVSDGRDRGQAGLVSLGIPWPRPEQRRPEAPQHGWQACAAAQGNDAQIGTGRPREFAHGHPGRVEGLERPTHVRRSVPGR